MGSTVAQWLALLLQWRNTFCLHPTCEVVYRAQACTDFPQVLWFQSQSVELDTLNIVPCILPGVCTDSSLWHQREKAVQKMDGFSLVCIQRESVKVKFIHADRLGAHPFVLVMSAFEIRLVRDELHLAWKTDKSRRRQQGAETRCCNEEGQFLSFPSSFKLLFVPQVTNTHILWGRIQDKKNYILYSGFQ